MQVIQAEKWTVARQTPSAVATSVYRPRHVHTGPPSLADCDSVLTPELHQEASWEVSSRAKAHAPRSLPHAGMLGA